jgi:SET domain-containing protein
VFLTEEGKGWGVRPLEDLPKGSFVCEYAGEILTNTELYERIVQSTGNERHTYPVTLDADWGSEVGLKDEEALCLDATHNGNVARFINHRYVLKFNNISVYIMLIYNIHVIYISVSIFMIYVSKFEIGKKLCY